MKLEKTKTLQKTSLWFAIASVLVFFVNLIVFITLAILGKLSSTKGEDAFTILTLSTEFITLACDIVWIVLAIICMIEGKKQKYDGPYVATVIAIILAIGLLFVSLLVFFTLYKKTGAEDHDMLLAAILSFILFLVSAAGSMTYISACSRWKHSAARAK